MTKEEITEELVRFFTRYGLDIGSIVIDDEYCTLTVKLPQPIEYIAVDAVVTDKDKP